MSARPQPLPLWGGVECTVNRVGDCFFDQIARTGHADRISDLQLVADLGIRTLRYPVLWERTAPDGPHTMSWRWTDERMAVLARLEIEPIVGLLHHGSGPRGTHLLDPSFPEKLARYAGAVAARYPAVSAYTPINEPLTTARFSALYGHWYPHARSDGAFVRALLLQCRAIALAMRAIREVNPEARLVQTEDVAPTRSTPCLGYQAAFERERRWLTFDLLAGRVTEAHPLWRWLRRSGHDARLLDFLATEPCEPDVYGVNYYVTSERFLDHRVALYPDLAVGGNGLHRYIDLEAVRACDTGLIGCGTLLEEVWRRYGKPVAVTEAHLACSDDEQLRWIAELWSEARAAQASGVDVRGFTVWSLFGAYDWHCLATRADGVYEPGVFDVRGGTPTATSLVPLVRQLALGARPEHPALASSGWWRLPSRLHKSPSHSHEHAA